MNEMMMHLNEGNQEVNDNAAIPSRLSRSFGPFSSTTASSPINPSQVDSMLAQELHKLSFQDRSRIEEEIHGVQSVAGDETPEMVGSALDAFQYELGRLRSAQKEAYEVATVMDSKYVQDRDFRLKYLRAALFDPKKAALMFCKYLDLLYRYYGPQTLLRPLRYDDLGKAEQDKLRVGNMQVLPSRDRAGRLVVLTQGCMCDVSLLCRLRIALYTFTVTSEDEETQRLGMVYVHTTAADTIGKSVDDFKRPETRREYERLCCAMPVRTSAMHVCLPAPQDSVLAAKNPALFHTMRALVILLLQHAVRVRTRVHQGLSMETRYRLMSFGIKVDEIPVTSSGTIKTKNHHQWIKTRKAIDERRRVLAIRQRRQDEHRQQLEIQQRQQQQQRTGGLLHHHIPMHMTFNAPPIASAMSVACATATTTTSSVGTNEGPPRPIIVHPGVRDVLIARGGKSNHWGNLDFLCLLGSKLQEYKGLPKRSARRKEIRVELIQAVYSRNGRFLEMDDEIVSNVGSNKASSKINGNNKKKIDSGDWWRQITDEADLDDHIKTAIYDYSRRLEAKRNLQRSTGGTSKFSGLDGTDMNINKRRRRLVTDNVDPSDHGGGGSESGPGGFLCHGVCD